MDEPRIKPCATTAEGIGTHRMRSAVPGSTGSPTGSQMLGCRLKKLGDGSYIYIPTPTGELNDINSLRGGVVSKIG